MQLKKAIIICIGDELLIGQIIDTNSAWIAQQLNLIGIQIVRKLTISDTAPEIIAAINNNKKDADLIIFTGGLGPTKDDITKQTLNDYFGNKLIKDEAVLAHIHELFSKKSKAVLPANEQQAFVPDSCTVLFNKLGTAPGMLFVQEDCWIVSLPGVPYEVKDIMNNQLLPRIRAINKSKLQILHKNLVFFGKGESKISDEIQGIENALPEHIHLAYLPHFGVLKLRLSGMGEDFFKLRNEINTFAQLIRDREKDFVIAEEDISIEEAVVKQLTLHRLTISTAESCTGGQISSRITDVPGASEVYKGSIISYANEIKNKILFVSDDILNTVGAVSESTVIQMATAVRNKMQTDIAVAVSGILGPTGGTAEKPIGLAYIAIAHQWDAKAFKFQFNYDRAINKELVVQHALNLILQAIKELTN
ncbi:MAG TPA: competence/damage-inducible protein A [Edaphocola sp.]|nr:competence/damage-inducible protein A [Edaphocola sp.]